MLNALTFVFVFATPFVYNGPLDSGEGWISSLLVCFCCYGLLEIGEILENPFGFDEMDLDLQNFGKSMVVESDVIALTAREFCDWGNDGTVEEKA